MFRQSRRDSVKENSASPAELAVQLAQDKKFRKRLLAAMEQASGAGQRTRRSIGARGGLARLASDRTLLRELEGARRDLEQTYRRVEQKRGHKLRKLIVIAPFALLAAVPQLRERILAAIKGATQFHERSAQPREHTAGSTARTNSFTGALTLEDLTKEELYTRAQEADVPGRSEMSKEQLVEALRARS
jgi:hypothetical protein